MGRKVKLYDCNEFGDSSINYKAPNGKYYTSKEAFDKIKLNSDYRQKCIAELVSIMDLDNTPSYIMKKLQEYTNYEAVYKVICDKQEVISNACYYKQFANLSAKIGYVFAIISNNYDDVVKYLKRQEKIKQDMAAVPVSQENIVDIENVGIKHTDDKSDIINGLLGDI